LTTFRVCTAVVQCMNKHSCSMKVYILKKKQVFARSSPGCDASDRVSPLARARYTYIFTYIFTRAVYVYSRSRTLSAWLSSYSRRVPLQNAYSRSSRSSWMRVVRACFLTCLSFASSSDATESRWLILGGVVGVRGASHNKGVRSY
jgi:hypothetical protein